MATAPVNSAMPDVAELRQIVMHGHDVFYRVQPEAVFHLAAQADVRVAVERPDDDAAVNVLGTVRTVREFLPLLRARSGYRRIVLTASSSVLAPAVRLGARARRRFQLNTAAPSREALA